MDDQKMPIFSAEETKAFSELRLNSIVESISRQRDNAFNQVTRVEAELAVKSSQLELLSSRLTSQLSTIAKLSSELELLRGANALSSAKLSSTEEALSSCQSELDAFLAASPADLS